MYRFNIRKNKHGKFVVRFQHRGETIFTSPPYSVKEDALELVVTLQETARDALIEDKT